MFVYKIHPALGVARVGSKNSNAFFVGPVKPGEPGVEIAANGTESAVVKYKVAGEIKRHGARPFLAEAIHRRRGTRRQTPGRARGPADASVSSPIPNP